MAGDLSRTREYVKKKKISGRAFVQGVISFGIFLLSLVVVFVAYIPLIKSARESVKKRESLQKEIDSLNKKYEIVNGYGADKLLKELSLTKKFIPDDIKVAELATFINAEATKFNLEVVRLGISEDKTEVTKTSKKDKEKLIGTVKAIDKVYLGRIEGPFTFSGSRDDIFAFLDFLVEGGYATNFDKVNIVSQVDSKDGDEKVAVGNWSVSLFTAYYYLQPISDVNPKTPLVQIRVDVLEDAISGTTKEGAVDYSIHSGDQENPSEVDETPSVTPSVTDAVEE